MIHPNNIIEAATDFWQKGDVELKHAVVEVVTSTAGDTGSINPTQSKECLKQIHRRINSQRHGKLSDTQYRLVCKALEKINATGLIRCAVPPAPVKSTRPSVLPDNKGQWESQDVAQTYLDDTAKLLDKPESAETIALLLFYRLVAIGYGLEPAISIVCRLRQGDLEPEQSGLLQTPVHYLETGPYMHQTILPKQFHKHFKAIARFNRRRKIVAGRHQRDQWAIYLPSHDSQPTREQEQYRHRFNQLKQQLRTQHKIWFRAWAAQQDAPINAYLRSLPYFSRTLRLRALAQGMEVAFYHQLESLPLPAETPLGLAAFLIFDQLTGYPPVGVSSATMRHHRLAPWSALSNLMPAPLAEQDICETITSDWALDAKFLLRAFVTDAKLQLGEKRLSKGQLKPLEILLLRYQNKAQHIAPVTSALFLALLWIGRKLHHQKITVRTADEYLRNIVINGVLAYDGAFDLGDWDDEDVEEARLRVIRRQKPSSKVHVKSTEPSLADNTFQNRQDQLADFLAFCQSQGALTDATLAKERLIYAMSQRRNRVLGLQEFDQLQFNIRQSAAQEAELINSLLTLGFYAGLRSGEMLALSLDDIEVCGPEIYVRIRRGKTAAARRKIPLHLLAPKRVCEPFLEYLDTRLAAAGKHKAKLKKVAFIGPTRSVQGYKREELIPAVIGLLRYYVGPEFDMHSLRHGFGTWLMLRAYVLKHPELKAQLLEQQHALFRPEGEARLTQLFQWTEDKPLLPGRITMFIHIRKLMGHSHISVLLQNYLHAFGVIHQFLMRRM